MEADHDTGGRNSPFFKEEERERIKSSSESKLREIKENQAALLKHKYYDRELHADQMQPRRANLNGTIVVPNKIFVRKIDQLQQKELQEMRDIALLNRQNAHSKQKLEYLRTEGVELVGYVERERERERMERKRPKEVFS